MDTLKTIRDSIIVMTRNFSDDSPFTNTWIDNEINNVRLSIINRMGPSLPPTFYQRIDCLEVKKKSITCNGLTNNIEELYVDLPGVIVESGSQPLKFFGDSKATFEISYVNLSSFVNQTSGVWVAGDPVYTIMGEEAYIRKLSKDAVKYLMVVAVLKDPQNACNFTENSPYPLPGEHTERLKYVVRSKILDAMGVPYDDRDNARDDQQFQTQPEKQQEE